MHSITSDSKSKRGGLDRPTPPVVMLRARGRTRRAPHDTKFALQNTEVVLQKAFTCALPS